MLTRVWDKLLSFFKPKPKAEKGIKLLRGGVANVSDPGLPPRTPGPRGIRRTDLGMRKLRRHRAGRQHEKRSGIDHGKRMDGEFRDTGKKKKRGWAEDREKRPH